MRLLAAALLCLLALAPAASARPPAGVDVTSCRASLDPELRLAAFEGAMERVPGTERMQMRFTLQERRPAARWRSLDAEGWDAWVTSDPGVKEYHYTREVGRLAAPAGYRTVIRFRWLDAEGAVLARRRARSEVCHQPDLRPDLEVASLAFRDGAWRLTFRNAGRTRAGASVADLTVDGEVRRVIVRGIRSGDTRSVVVPLGPCTAGGAGVTVVADAADAIDERDEGDNAVSRPCSAR